MFRHSAAPEETVARMFAALAGCYPERYRLAGTNVVMRADAGAERVAVITSGGAGAEPQFACYAAPGLADAACVGNLRAAPNAYALYEAGKELGREHGVLFVYNNFAGDFLNNDMAAEMLALDGIRSESVLVTDDIASARGEARENRGGLCGILFVLKVAAGAARRGLPLAECRRLADCANARLGSVTLVEDAAAGDVMIGAGFSGEPPLSRSGCRDIDSLARKLSALLADDIRPRRDERLEVLVNRLSGSTLMDSVLFAQAVREAFAARGQAVGNVRVGNYFHPFPARGYYLSVLAADGELGDYLKDIVYTESFSL